MENPADLVRLEIAAALERDIRVIPVLVQGVQMPLEIELPEDLKGLASRNALEVSDTRFRYDVDRLIEALEAPGRGNSPMACSWNRHRLQLVSSWAAAGSWASSIQLLSKLSTDMGGW